MLGAADEVKGPSVWIVVVHVIDGALLFEVVRQCNFLDGDAFGFVMGRIGLGLGGRARVGDVCREEAWKEPGHAATEGRYAGA